VLAKKIFPSNNPFFAWESQNLLENKANKPPFIQIDHNNYTIVKYSIEEHKSLIDLNGMTTLSIKKASNNNESCWVVKTEDKIAGYVWISSKQQRISSDTGYCFPINKGQGAYWWRDLYVLPEHRGKKLTELLFSEWVKSFDENRQEPLYTEVSPDNIVSMKVHCKLGFKEFCKLRMVCLLGMRFYLLKIRKQYHLNYRFCFSWLY